MPVMHYNMANLVIHRPFCNEISIEVFLTTV
uniref:Uncharacterized protein n=1 Tax=Anguilla anguilla TaxID=7936 RepID=A0A0E9TA36_ANGAN